MFYVKYTKVENQIVSLCEPKIRANCISCHRSVTPTAIMLKKFLHDLLIQKKKDLPHAYYKLTSLCVHWSCLALMQINLGTTWSF